MVAVITTTEMGITQETVPMTDLTLTVTTTSCLTGIKAIRVTKGLTMEPTMGRSMGDIIPGTEEGTVTVDLGILIKAGIMVFQRDSWVTSTKVRILLGVQKVVLLLFLLLVGIRRTTNGMEPLTVIPDIAHHHTHGLLRTGNIRMVNVIVVVVGQGPPPDIVARTGRAEGPIESSILILRTTNEWEAREYLSKITPGRPFNCSKNILNLHRIGQPTAFHSHRWQLYLSYFLGPAVQRG